MADWKGRTALVTGATDGVGRMVAARLGEMGVRVLAHGRDEARGAALVSEIKTSGGETEFLRADLSSLAQVRSLAEAVAQRTDELHLLINNAGIGTAGPRETSVDGHETRFAVNYLAGYLLVALLRPLLAVARPARVVNVASAGQQAIDFDDVMLTKSFSGARAYCQSKLAQIMMAMEFSDELAKEGVTINALHPASYMATTMVKRAGVTPWSTVEEGADAIMQLAASPQLEGRSGLYFNGLSEARADAQAYGAHARKQLRELSEKLVAQFGSPLAIKG
ncbi:SDR family NAD(P)-dependent oxidoreductase [Terrarubrum flagellatum]|uniref:SDR family NAD(P)-dependent oxidoreductase n=1 Tax=Terrirubrum flagellatum TaxID=2895980 RepID=UPI0031451F5C